ncbi:hypothetical protein MNBD_NITROSPINAE01-1624 [hydrothermal vent metagenome]|uniref:SH3b domain-containing protein n=1 Tax=hydrothermal vent metagenome TaxID=652676 RepID=A0A3B1B9T0_9ZZZZ
MMKKLFSILLVVIVLAPVLALSEPIYVEGGKAKVRSGPGTSYQVLWEAPKYTPFEYLARFKEWYAIRDKDGDVGWVHKQVIGKGRSAVVVTKKANIRKGPGTKNPIVFSVEKNYLFRVLDKKGAWYKLVDKDGDTGWALDKLLWVSK